MPAPTKRCSSNTHRLLRLVRQNCGKPTSQKSNGKSGRLYTHQWLDLKRYPEKILYLTDNNRVECDIRLVAIGRKALLFSDTQSGAALPYSVSC